MKPVPMKFGEYVWHHNPQNISFECDRSVAEMKSPFGESSVQDMGRKNMKISGSGQLYGENCAEQVQKQRKRSALRAKPAEHLCCV